MFFSVLISEHPSHRQCQRRHYDFLTRTDSASYCFVGKTVVDFVYYSSCSVVFLDFIMVDCLSLLRSYNLHRKEIVERDEFIIFDQSAFPRSTKTNYQIFKAGVDKTPKDYYTLETLLFLLKHASLIHAHYLPKANNAKIPPIRFPDRRSLLNYLNGEIDTAPGIDKNGPMDMPVPPPPLKRNLIASGLDDSASRTKHEDNRKKRPANDEHIVLKLIPEDQVFYFIYFTISSVCPIMAKLCFINNERATLARASCYSLYICTRAFGPRYEGKLPLTIEIYETYLTTKKFVT